MPPMPVTRSMSSSGVGCWPWPKAAPTVILLVFHHAPLRRTGRYQPDGTLDLTWEDGTERGATDIWEATHNRSVAGSRPTSPTQRRRSQACRACFCLFRRPSLGLWETTIQPALQAGRALVRISKPTLSALLLAAPQLPHGGPYRAGLFEHDADRVRSSGPASRVPWPKLLNGAGGRTPAPAVV
jgi:hypothetical protein